MPIISSFLYMMLPVFFYSSFVHFNGVPRKLTILCIIISKNNCLNKDLALNSLFVRRK